MNEKLEELQQLFNEFIADGTPQEALERAEEVQSFVDSAIEGLKADIEAQTRDE